MTHNYLNNSNKKVLKINLSSGSVSKGGLPAFLRENYLGGKGVGTYINCHENPAGLDPLAPENKMIMAVGPAAGTSIPTSTRVGLYAKSPLSNLGIDSYLGGSFGHHMRKAGYDVIMIEGRSKLPVYIKIDDDKVSIEDARSLWGKDIYTTEDNLKEVIGGKVRVLSIGPAGENLIRYSCIGHDHNRHFGRMGSGAVMGSKNLKAVALTGRGDVKVFDPDGLKKFVRGLNVRIKEHPATGTVYPAAGTVSFVSKANSLGVFPSRYWQRGRAAAPDKIDFDYISKTTLVKNSRCFGCSFGCAHINRVKDGPYEGVEIDGPEYETIYTFGGLCEVKDIREIIMLNDRCDRLGLDTMHTGNVLGLLMEATERKKVPKKYHIEYGDTEKILLFLDNIAAGKEGWDIIGQGVEKVAEHFGLEDIAIHVKGLEPAGYDPRGLTAMAVTFGIGNRGATHLSSNAYARDISGTARDFELEGEDKSVDRLSFNRKAELVYNMINFNAIADCFIFCRFLNRDLMTWEDYSEALYLLTGIEKNKNDFVKIANNIVTLGRWYNINNGLTAADDLLPERFYTEPLDPDGSMLSKFEYRDEISKYYSLRNWSHYGIPAYHPDK
jgi:aldehyde:ferredoxin oxidoreductase